MPRQIVLLSACVLAFLSPGNPPATAGPPADHYCVVVDEVSTSSPGDGSAVREYFELRNVCAVPVIIGGYKVRIYAQVHGVETLIVDYIVPFWAVLDGNRSGPWVSGQFWTVTHAAYPAPVPPRDGVYWMTHDTVPDVPEEFSLELHSSGLIDAVSTDLASARGEGAKAVQEPFGSGLSVSRNSLSTDTNINAVDFALRRESASAPSDAT